MIPKSIFRKGYTYLLLCLSGLVFPIHILSQTPQAGIASQPDHQDGIVISCAGGAMSFTGFQGGLFDAPKSYAFFVIRAGDTLASLAYVYKVQLSTDLYFLPAISLGMGSSRVNINDFVFEDQLNATTGFINTESIDPLGDRLSNVNYFDLGASFIIHSTRFMTGLSLKHLNRPNTSFNKEKQDRLPVLISLQGSYEIDLNPYERGLLPRYSFLYLYGVLYKIPRATIFNFSQEIQMGPIAFGTSQQLAFTDRPRFNNLGVSMALSVENFDFGLQYNFPFRKQNEVYAPSLFELYVSFNFTPFRRNNRGLFKRLQTDNYLSP